jgi:Putative Actinobacterial Holin-X, holin superfamily III
VEVDGTSQSRDGEPAAASSTEDEPQDSVTELLEELARETSALVFYEARLAASRNAPKVRRAARDVAFGLVVAVTFLTAFALANAAAVLALATAMSAWVAALALAVVWAAIGVVLALFLQARVRGAEWSVEDAEQARAEAEQAVRDTLERLAPAITREMALAAVPMAGDMADGVVDAGEDLIEGADEIMDTITEDVPGGGMVNQIWDIVLMPGRFGVRVATTVLKRESSS